MIKLLMGLLWFLIIPEIIGLGILCFSRKENKNMMFALVLGYMFSFMIFEILAIPMTFLKCRFTTLAYMWIFFMIMLTLIFALLIKRNIKEIIKYNLGKLKKLPILFTILVLLLVEVQAFVGFEYMHEDYDDSNFLAKATIARDTNTLYKYDDIGREYESVPTRQVFSPFPFYTATISLVMDIHPAIIAHTVFPIIFIPLAYIVYAMIGDVLFKENKRQTLIFLIILSLIYIWGAYSVHTNFVFLLYRVWQGKAILANIVIPFIWLLFIKYINKDEKIFYWFVLLVTLWGADLVSSMALSLGTITASLLAIIFGIKDKKPSYLFKTAICFIPSIVYGIMYLTLK